jgi:LPXTG-motif cell wall-anchored protein
MRRWAGLVLALGVGVIAPGAASMADASPYPGNPARTVLGGQFTPGGTGTLNVGGAVPNTPNPGTIDGTISVSDTSDAAGVLNYAGFSVPATFALNASHAITFADGAQLTFCVGSSGAVVACSLLTPATTTPPALPTTGGSHLDDVAKIGAAAIAAGALLLFWRRRQLAHD